MRPSLERETGIEPATNGLGSRYSTIELLPPVGNYTLTTDHSTSRIRHQPASDSPHVELRLKSIDDG
jgi:hypothetical protein